MLSNSDIELYLKCVLNIFYDRMNKSQSILVILKCYSEKLYFFRNRKLISYNALKLV